MRKSSWLEDRFQVFLDAWSIKGWEREYEFSPFRKWRFDFANPGTMAAVEIQGGSFNFGGHNRGASLVLQYEKMNWAQALGWRVFQVSRVSEMEQFVNWYSEVKARPVCKKPEYNGRFELIQNGKIIQVQQREKP